MSWRQRKRNVRVGDEHKEQSELIYLCKKFTIKIPELDMIYAVPNEGMRSYTTRNLMLEKGLKSGVPDLCLPVARNGHHGLYIEMKAGKNKSTPIQLSWQIKLREQGYDVREFHSGTEAFEYCVFYLTGKSLKQIGIFMQ